MTSYTFGLNREIIAINRMKFIGLVALSGILIYSYNFYDMVDINPLRLKYDYGKFIRYIL